MAIPLYTNKANSPNPEEQPSPQSRPGLEPATWGVNGVSFVNLHEHDISSDHGESVISTEYLGQPVAEFDIAEWHLAEGRVDIIDAGRPRHWGPDSYRVDERQRHYRLGFKAAFRHLAQTREINKVAVSSGDVDMLRAIITTGRPRGWLRRFVTVGSQAGEQAPEDGQTAVPSEALNWLNLGGLVDVVYSRPTADTKVIQIADYISI